MEPEQPSTGPSVSDAAKQREIGELYRPFDPRYTADPAAGLYLRAHREAPVAYCAAFSAYLVTGYAEVVQVLRDPVRFSSAKNLDPVLPVPKEVLAVLERGFFPLPPALFNNDPPGHARARSLFARAFTPARVAELEPRIRRYAGECIDALVAADVAADIMPTLAFPLPMKVIAELIGIPFEEMAQLKAWQDGWFRIFDPTAPLAQRLADAEGFVAYNRYYLDLIERRRAAPADDLVSALILARIDGETPFTNAEIVSHLLVLLVAGFETTAGLLGSLLYQLLARPPLWKSIGGDPALLAAATEETLRLDAPVQMEPRRTTTKVVVGGVEIGEGATLFVFFGGANYDAQIFQSPQTFDLQRSANARHLGFGWGVHACLGASLARLETRITMQLLRERLPSLSLAPETARTYAPSMFFRSPAAVPVTWTR